MQFNFSFIGLFTLGVSLLFLFVPLFIKRDTYKSPLFVLLGEALQTTYLETFIKLHKSSRSFRQDLLVFGLVLIGFMAVLVAVFAMPLSFVFSGGPRSLMLFLAVTAFIGAFLTMAILIFKQGFDRNGGDFAGLIYMLVFYEILGVGFLLYRFFTPE